MVYNELDTKICLWHSPKLIWLLVSMRGRVAVSLIYYVHQYVHNVNQSYDLLAAYS